MRLPAPTRRAVLGSAAASVAVLAIGPRANAEPKVHEIAIKRFAYEPDEVQVRIGDTIRWTNLDIVPHTASANDLSWDTTELTQGESAELVIENSVEQTYFCAFHPHMTGTIKII